MPSASLVLPPTPAATAQATAVSSRASKARLPDARSAAADARALSSHRQSSFRDALGRAADRGGPRRADHEPREAAADGGRTDTGDERVDSGKPDRSAKAKSGKAAKADPKSRRLEVESDDATSPADAERGDAATAADAAPATDDAGTATDDLPAEEHEQCEDPVAAARAADGSAVPASVVNPNIVVAGSTAPTAEASACDATDTDPLAGVTAAGTEASADGAPVAAAAAPNAADGGAAGGPGEADEATTDQPQQATAGRPTTARRGPAVGQPAADGRGADDAVATDAGTRARAGQAAAATADDVTAFQQFAEMFAPSADGTSDGAKSAEAAPVDATPAIDASAAAPQPQQARETPRAPAPAAPEPPTESRFTADNHEKIVDGVRGELLPSGGTMKLKLDPPELGALQVSLHMKDGVVTAAFQPSNDDAARLLSHTLSDLRSTLESHGIVVDKLHVQQAPKDEGSSNPQGGDRGSQQQTLEQRGDARRDQQRKDMVQRLWDKLVGKGPLDITV